MQFTRNEKYAIIFVLTELMKADGIIDNREKEYLEQVYEELNISVSDLSFILDLDLVIAQKIITSMSKEKKEQSIRYFSAMAKCDGFIDPRELYVIHNFTCFNT